MCLFNVARLHSRHQLKGADSAVVPRCCCCAQVVRAHGLRVVALDIDIDTMAPRLDLLPRLVTPRSRLLILANIYGRGYDLAPYLSAAAELGLEVIKCSPFRRYLLLPL